ncbi:MAG: DUF5916 domain-containing protein [Bacteroidetes bacterium]|nr:DUF5916 domain-containing protein [Bacteroidota bacterium]MCY4205370.1 DUF5916 domain-containing protein [Bacteroidota bacterium]
MQGELGWKYGQVTLFILFILLQALSPRPDLLAQEWEVTPVFIEEPPNIDGNLDDEIWAKIDPITEFTQVWPDEGASPTELSEVRIAYNRDYLFFAFRFFDKEPHLIRAKNLERGGRNDRDDHAYVSLDTYLDKRNAYLFEMNALGTQDDATITDEGLTLDSFSWDAVFRSETQINEDGWTMEASIPFRQLRFPKGDTVDFGLMLSRMINRKNERVIWPPIGLEFGGRWGVISAVSQYGVLKGLRNIRRGKNIEIKPYVITGVQQVREDYDIRDMPRTFERDIGVDLKYGITSNITLDLTVNTDFAQVEADNVQLNLTRFSLFFPEKREFFLERSGLFEHGSPRSTQTFFSRRIGLSNQILAGARATGQFGRFSVGLLDIETGEGMGDTFGSRSTNNLVARVRASLSSRATVGTILTNYAAPNRTNRAFGMDAQYRFWSASEFEAWYTRVTDDGLADDGNAGHANLTLLNDKYGIEASYTSVGENFHPALGFVRRRDMRRFAGSAQYTPIVSFDAVSFIRQFAFEVEYEYIQSQMGELQSQEFEVSAEAAFNRRDGIGFEYSREFERLLIPFNIRPNTQISSGDYSFGRLILEGQTDSSRRLFGTASTSFGAFFNGDRTDLEAQIGFRQSRYLQMEAGVGYSRIDLPVENGRFDATTVSMQLLGAVNRKLFATALMQYDNFTRDLQANIRIDWIHTPGSDLFFVFNTAYHFANPNEVFFDPHRDYILTNRTAVAKLTYLILL